MVSKLKLISKVYTEDSIGQMVAEESATEVFADVLSVSASEFANAGVLGFKALFQFQVWTNEYSGQDVVEYENARYSIYRTYDNPNGRTELYVQRDVGV